MKQKRKFPPETFINRELSWLSFNERVLEEAHDQTNPLFERLRFTSICSSNLDEFFMIRVASIWDQVHAGFEKPDPAGLPPHDVMARIADKTHELVAAQYNCFRRSLVPALKKEGIRFEKPAKLNRKQLEFLDDYYQKTVYPVLTPMVVDQGRPFPLILSRSLNIALLLRNPEKGGEPLFGMIQVPSVLDRVIAVPDEGAIHTYVFLEDLIKMMIDKIFSGHKVLSVACFRVTRNADLGFDEEGAEDLLHMIQQSLKQRKWGATIRLEYESAINARLLAILEEELDPPATGLYEIQGPLDLTFLNPISNLPGYDSLRYPPHKPVPVQAFPPDENVFDVIARKDVLVHHPFESFDPVVNLVQQAAVDPKVLAIKQTLYRVSGNSPIVQALVQAAENGKQVTALVEIKARFDEENNILWAKRLEIAGCHVIYGLVGLKTHGKLLLVVRREEDGIKRYVHMGTGNYNDVTARFYTDLGLFTANPHYGADTSAVFNMLSGYSRLSTLHKFHVAPVNLRQRFSEMILQEAANARNGIPSRIIIKANSIVDHEIISALYEASQAGVHVDLIVRGICCLRPGIPGISDRITVRSIVGRLLEHSRIYYFANSGEDRIYLASADLMDRNLDRRVEVMFPVEDPEARQNVKNILELYLRDTVKARVLNRDGSYTRVDKRGKESFNSQEYLTLHPNS